MNAMHQYLFDTYRAAQHGERTPPLPGTHDVATLRPSATAAASTRSSRASARGRLRTALSRRFHPKAC